MMNKKSIAKIFEVYDEAIICSFVIITSYASNLTEPFASIEVMPEYPFG